MTPNLVLKVAPFFDTESQTATEYRYGHSYYRRRIGNRTQAFVYGTNFRIMPFSVTLNYPLSNRDFKVTQIFDVEYGINGTK